MLSKSSSPNWERVALAGGLIFVVAMIVSAFVAPFPAEVERASEVDVGWFDSNRTALLAQVVMRGVGAVAQVVFVAALVGLLRRVEGGVSTLGYLILAGGITHTIMLLIANAAQAAAVVAASDGAGSEVVHALQLLGFSFLVLEAMPGAMLITLASIAVLRSGIAPRWVGWLGFAVAPFYMLAASAFPGTPHEAIGFLAMFLEFIWFATASVQLVLRSGAARPAAQPQSVPA